MPLYTGESTHLLERHKLIDKIQLSATESILKVAYWDFNAGYQ